MKRCCVAHLLFLVALRSASAAVPLEYVDVYTAGVDGYGVYCVPTIEIAPDGTLLAFAEGRKQGGEDPGMNAEQDIDLVLKRSTDGGKTWSAMDVIDDPGEFWSGANATSLVDHDTQKVWIIFIRCKPGANTMAARPGTDDAQTVARWSDDNGSTWSDPIDLTPVARDMHDKTWRITVPGPGGGIQTASGRLLVPCWKQPWNVFTLYSDDQGETWQRGQFVPDSDRGVEPQFVELADGRIMVEMRQNFGPRWRSVSSDGGITWGPIEKSIPAPQCACAIQRLSHESTGDRNRILWTGPKGPGRVTLIGKLSYDEGKTFPTERVIYEQNTGYSDLTLLEKNVAGCLWERNNGRFMSFTRLPLEDLEKEKPPIE